MFWGQKTLVHLIGIGGSGMSGIAEVLLASGVSISGSDISETPITNRLKSLGATVYHGHSPENLKSPTCVVISSAVTKENSEYQMALKLRIPVIQRAEMLAELMRLKLGIAIAGSHGKTTTTSMTGQFLRSIDPSVVVGGRLQHWNASSLVGKGETFVIEADESDRSFLRFSPVYSVVTNIDREHMDTYKDFDDLKATFLDFMNRTAFFGRNWIGFDCPVIREISSQLSKPFSTYGFHSESDLKIENLKTSPEGSVFDLSFHGQNLGVFTLPVVGLHNVKNATGAIGICISMKMDLDIVRKACAEFVPADRRLQVHFDDGANAVVEDYGHHPTEIRATLEALKIKFPDHAVQVVFQPHRFSRTASLFEEFAPAFDGLASRAILFPIYAAHEEAISGITSESLAGTFKVPVTVTEKVLSVDEVLVLLKSQTASKNVVLILGAAPLTSLAVGLAEHYRVDRLR